jgi:D-glycero-D-manno-heptose 1,7-bisphosphate phosphatase
MKAVFVHRNCLLRDSHIDPASPVASWQLTPATIEAVRLLANGHRLVFLYGQRATSPEGAGEDGLEALVKQVEAGGGRIDGLLLCPHRDGAPCRCWGEHPGIFWVAASQFNLQLAECYALADAPRDVVTAYAAGVRPLMVLCQRTIGQVLGNQPERKDFPIAMDLTQAVSYIGVEEDISQQLGRPRSPSLPVPSDEVLFAEPGAVPLITVSSAVGQSQRARVTRSRAQLRDIARWLTFFVLGAVGLSLGIAYLLTHFYRIQPFPDYVYWVTLQFIPRALRGIIFIAWGIGVIALALRSLYRSTTNPFWRQRAR